MRRKIYVCCLRLVQIITLLLAGILLISGVLVTCFSTDMVSQKVLTRWDNLFLTLPATALFTLILFAVSAGLSKAPRQIVSRIMHLFILCWFVFACGMLILFGKSVPAGDAYSIYSIAQSLAAGDTSVIQPTGSYLSYYPHQIGLVAFWEILIRLWNLTHIDQHAYHFIKIVYLLLGAAAVFLQAKTVHMLWKDERTDYIFLLLEGANLPLLMYTSFLYGEIPSFAALSAFFYFVSQLLSTESSSKNQKKHRLLLGFGCLLSLTLSVMLRKNSLIFVIAAVLVLSIWGIHQKRPRLVLLAALCAACAIAVIPCIQKIYEYRADSYLSSGVPAAAFLAMGMQESSRANGWYNGFNFNTYHESGLHTETAVAVSQAEIMERLNYFKENPGYAVIFYLQKFLSQWADGTYACRQASLATFGGRADFFVSLYEGEHSRFVIEYCNIFQNIIYLGAFCFCLVTFRTKKQELPVYLGLVGVLGGFLFHMIWEANARYIFLYGLVLLPYAAKGLSLLSNWRAARQSPAREG